MNTAQQKFKAEQEVLAKAQADFEEKKKRENELFQDRLEKQMAHEKKLLEDKLKSKLATEQAEQFEALQKE
ncbi:MAG: hypothetical protein JJ909_11155, partial [Roseivirga sp.]|nr:hypothetical protein [Roseivirga sp.]